MIEKWSKKFLKDHLTFIQARKKAGFIRDCHGDLHLGNMFLSKNKTIIFDRIEFNPNFRIIDVINDIAFLLMDLEAKQQVSYAFLFLNHYLNLTGDYEGLRLLNFYKTYRAMVRAKVHLLNNNAKSFSQFCTYLGVATQFIEHQTLQMLITYGVSGSGKTFFSKKLATEIKAIHIRSDIERKRIFKNIQGKSLYTPAKSKATFERLAQLAKLIIESGYSVIVDATFLRYQDRQIFFQLSKILNVSFKILDFKSSHPIRVKRIKKRLLEKTDASDADVLVMEEQLRNLEFLTQNEMEHSITIQSNNQ